MPRAIHIDGGKEESPEALRAEREESDAEYYAACEERELEEAEESWDVIEEARKGT